MVMAISVTERETAGTTNSVIVRSRKGSVNLHWGQ